MVVRTAAILVGVSAAVLSASPQTPQTNTAVTSATVRVIRKPVDAQFIYVENRRGVPLVEWRIELLSAENRGRMTTVRNYRGGFGLPEGPIAPHERRQQRVEWRGQRLAATANVKLVVFADGSYAGTTEGIAEFLREQDALAADLTYWQRTLRDLPRTSPAAAQEYLREKARERAQVDSSDASHIRGSIPDWSGPNRSADWVFTRANHALREAGERLEEVASYRKHADGDTAAEHAVAVWTASGQGTNFVAVIENLRDTPLEAFQFDFYKSPASRSAGGIGFDACTNLDDASQPRGRLSRHETREYDIGPADDLPDSATPKAVVSFALWRDLSWEGSPDEQDRFLKQREQRAGLYAFWIAALKDATGRPPGETIAFLRQKREERRREAPDETDFMQGSLQSWGALANRDPGAFSQGLALYRSRLEQQHALLTRHLKR